MNVTAKETIEWLSKYSELIGAKRQQMIEAGNKQDYSTAIKIQNEIKLFELEVNKVQSELLGGVYDDGGQLQYDTATTNVSVAVQGGSDEGSSTLSKTKKQSPIKKKITVKLKSGSNNDITQQLNLPTYCKRPKTQHYQTANYNDDNETAIKARKVSEGKFI